MNKLHSALIIAVVSLVTAALRFAPFLLFGKRRRKDGGLISWMSAVLPFAIMGMLVVFCLKDMSFTSAADWMPQLICCALVAALQYFWDNTLLSIICGTAVYMLLVQLVFI